MKNLLAFMKPNSTTKISTSSETPTTDSSLEQWGSRSVVDASICRNLEEELNKARALLKSVADGAVQKSIELMNTVKDFIGKKDEKVRAFRTKLTSLPTKSKLTPEKLANVAVVIQNGQKNDKRDQMKERIRAYVKRVEAKGQVPTIQKIQNSFSPEYPSKALVQELMKELGL